MLEKRKKLLISGITFLIITLLYFLIIFLIFRNGIKNASSITLKNILLNNRFSLLGAYLLVAPSLFLFILYKILFNILDYVSFTCSAIGIITACIFSIFRFKFLDFYLIYVVIIMIIVIGITIISFLNFRYYFRLFKEDKLFNEEKEFFEGISLDE